MVARFILWFKNPGERCFNDFCQRFPLLSSICVQLAAAVFMISVVGVIAISGGSVIWIFYKIFGVM